MTKALEFEGEQLFSAPRFGQLRYDSLGKEIIKQVNAKFTGTPAEIKRDYIVGKNQPIRASNPFIQFAVDRAGIEGKHDIRVYTPEQAELLLAKKRLPEMGQVYYDLGLCLDFSGKNHGLAVKLFEQLPTELRNLERLPAVMLGLNPTRAGNDVSFGYDEHSVMRTARILVEQTGNFDEHDAQLVLSGLPSKLAGGTRKMYTATQKKPSVENLGILRLFLNRYHNLSSNIEDLAGSGEDGRVGLWSGGAADAKLVEDYQQQRNANFAGLKASVKARQKDDLALLERTKKELRL